MSRDFHVARADLEHALQIAPADPALYQARAELYLNWWSFGARERFVRASADYATIVRLEIAAGLAQSEAQLLADVEAGEGQNPRDDEEKFAMVRRHARFSVALELAPHDAHIHIKRGISVWPELGYSLPTLADVAVAPLFDFLRAFQADPTLESPPKLAASLLKRYCWRESAHEQIEALLQARELLVEFGLDAELIGVVMDAVQTRLSET